MIRAIATHISTLRHPTASAADKVEALKFLDHFIGDIHQPLHAGHAENRGGNAIPVRFLGEETSLLEVGDSHLITRLGSDWRTLALWARHPPRSPSPRIQESRSMDHARH